MISRDREVLSRLKTLSGKRRQVWIGRCRQTSGGLRKKDLVQNRRGKIVSRKKSNACTGRRATGRRATGRRATGRRATGRRATGRRATGRRATGRRATGRRITGRRATGRRATARRATGRRATARRATARRATARRATARMSDDDCAHNPRGYDCAICMESRDGPRKHCQCGHSFHKRCIDKWLQRHDTCPLCRNIC